MSNSVAGALKVAMKSKKQFHCPAPPATSTDRLAVIVPVPICWEESGIKIATGVPTASPAVEPPLESAHPTHVSSASRTASENGSV